MPSTGRTASVACLLWDQSERRRLVDHFDHGGDRQDFIAMEKRKDSVLGMENTLHATRTLPQPKLSRNDTTMGTSKFFLPKKHQKAMRERRRKKRLAERGELHLLMSSKKQEEAPPKQHENTATANGSMAVAAERQSAESTRYDYDDRPKSRKVAQIPQHLSNKILIPADIQGDAKKVKKFRKDVRRQARTEGRDETKLIFVESLPKKKRKTFPRINELWEQERKQKSVEKNLDSNSGRTIPDDIKAKYVALDCEMVGTGSNGQKSVLARASLVDWWGKVLLDTYVKVPVAVTDFRTKYSGVLPKHIRNAIDPSLCRAKVAEILQDRILVGHALRNDLSVLMLQHRETRDTATYRPFQRLAANKKWRPRKLRDLVFENCNGMVIQDGSHDSVQDARAAMELYKSVREEWEQEHQNSLGTKGNNP